MLAGGGGAQIIYSVVGRQSAPHTRISYEEVSHGLRGTPFPDQESWVGSWLRKVIMRVQNCSVARALACGVPPRAGSVKNG